MGRSLALLLRFCVIASAVAVLILGVRAAHADDFAPAPGSVPVSGSVYGFNPGQGLPSTGVADAVPAPAPYVAAGPYSYGAPQPNFAQPPAPYVAAGPYGYNTLPQQNFTPSLPPAAQPPASAAPAPRYSVAQAQTPYGYNPALYPAPAQAPYGQARPVATTNYGTQMTADPQAYYQDPYNGAASRAHADYQLGAGDKIRVTVFGENDLSGEYQVDGSGVVRLPLIGTIRAVGYTAPALEAWIAAALSPNYIKNPRVNVEIITYRPFYITGAVNRPGQYPYVDNMSAMNAVAVAGGFMDSAKQSAIYVRHEGSTVEEEVPTDQITHIRPGDVVRVKTTLFWDAMSIFQPLAPAALAIAAVRP